MIQLLQLSTRIETFRKMSQNGQSGTTAVLGNSNTNGAEALFACTRCNSRHPFEELSSDMMLCKNCRDTFVVVKCTYCRTEFQQDSKNNLSSVCRKCEHNVKAHGKPTSCEYCNIIAAFIGTKCQRCTYSEKKYGPPSMCDQCKQRCAFDPKDEARRKKVDGKLLCWLCTLSYKRALAKAAKHSNKDRSDHRHHTGHHRSKRNSSSRPSCGGGNGMNGGNVGGGDTEESKKPRMEYVKSIMGNHSANGTFMPSPTSTSSVVVTASTSISSSVSSSMVNSSTGTVTSTTVTSMDVTSDMISANDNVVAVTQLRERISSLDKQIKNKNQELLKKDVRITELRSEINKEQRGCREKVQEMQKRHNERLLELQSKITTLTKEVATMSKEKKGKKGTTNDNSPLNF